MRILFLSDAYLPHAGGARVYYHELYSRLALRFGHHVTVVTTVGGQDAGAFDRAVCSDTFRIQRRHRPLESRKLKYWPKVIPAMFETLFDLWKERPDVVHFGDLFPQGTTCLLLKKLFGIRYSGYCHGEEVTQTALRRIQPFVRNSIYKNADCVIAANDFARRELLRVGVAPERMVKVLPGVDCRRFHPSPKPKDLLERYHLEEKLVLLTVSRLVPRKGHTTVIDALAELLPTMPNIRYVICGTGPYECEIRACAEARGVANAVIFAGYVSPADLPRYYNLCDIFVLANTVEKTTGDTEGFGMVFLEASACGKPVISGIEGGTQEAVDEGVSGYRVDARSAGAIATVIRRLIDNQALREQLGNNGLRRVHRDFDWDKAAADLHNAISALECSEQCNVMV